jgi:hypothetical protein
VLGGAPRRNSIPAEENRDPTQQEIEAVSALGFDQQVSTAAIRMANFNINQAIELLLTD